MRRRIIIMGMALLCTFSLFMGMIANAKTKTSGVHQNQLEEYILKEMPEAHVPGMTISIVNDNRELYCAAYGTVQKTEADFTMGALSQTITAAAILHLQEEDELKLDDTVGDHLTDYHSAEAVTIEQLLTHTSGLSKDSDLSDIKLNDEWGDYAYADVNYMLLGKIIESVTNMTYEEYVSDNIFDVLDMNSTFSLSNSKEFSENIVTGYQTYFGFHVPKEIDAQKNKEDAASNSLLSNVKDMGRYLQMFLNDGGKVLDKKSVKKILKGQGDVTDAEASDMLFGTKVSSGMGWMETKVAGTRVLYQLGTAQNATTVAMLLPEENLGITMMFNTMDYLVGQKLIQKMEKGILNIVLGKTADEIGSSTYMTKYAIVDGLVVLALVLAWLPIMMMGFWSHRRKNHIWSIGGICIDVLIHLVVPSVVLGLLYTVAQTDLIRSYMPDLFLAIWAFAISLYIGAVIKLIAMFVYTKKKHTAGVELEEQTVESEEAANSLVEKNEDKSVDKEDTEASKTEEKPADSATDNTTDNTGKMEEKSSESKTEKSEEKSVDSNAEKAEDKPAAKEEDKPEQKNKEKSADSKAEKAEDKPTAKEEDKPEQKSEEKSADSNAEKAEDKPAAKEEEKFEQEAAATKE